MPAKHLFTAVACVVWLAMAVLLVAKSILSKGADAAALLEQPDGRQGGHEDFHGPGGIHSAADDLLGLLQRPQVGGGALKIPPRPKPPENVRF